MADTDNTQNPQQNKTPYNDKVLIELFQEQISGNDIELEDVIQRIKTNENYDKIRDWVIKNKIATAREFASAIKGNKTYEVLGGRAENPLHMVRLFDVKHKIVLTFKKEISSSTGLDDGLVKKVSERNEYEQKLQGDPSKSMKLREMNEQIACSTKQLNLADISRKIRITATELDLHFNRGDIEDAIEEWVSEKRQARIADIFSKISYASSNIKGPRSEYTWIELASSMFESRESDDLSLPAKISLIKKFVWQVKRKIRNMKIENHIMPIFIGGQGTGKSTVINMILSPIEELTASTDFKQITDDRNIDIWEYFVLKTDEMGWASRSDIDNIKFLMTSPSLNRRFMRTNSAIPVKQNATFIGASNRELNQLIRDESGMRRFAGIKIRKDPQWERLNRINMFHLWQSVDEEAEDPSIPYMDEIRAYQERARVETSTEQWMNSIPSTFGEKCINSFDLFPVYKEWESTHYSKRKMDFDEWESEMCRLVTDNGSQYPFIVNDFGTSKEFQFITSRSKNRVSVAKYKQEAINKSRVERNREFAKDKLENLDNYKDFVDDRFDPSNDPDVLEYQKFLEFGEEVKEEKTSTTEDTVTPINITEDSSPND